LSDVSQGVGWWQASDGRWYPPKESEEAPEPGWWLAADGRWYPPVESADPPEPGWWLAADGRWYPPETTLDDAAPVAAAPDIDGGPEAAPEVVAAEREHEHEHEHEQVAEVAPTASDDAPATSSSAEVAPSAADRSGEREERRLKAVADRPPRTVEEASTRAAADRPRPSDASQQIRRRDDASREDAIAQASARFMAASRALKFLEADIEDNREHPGMSAARTTARAARVEAKGGTPSAADAPIEGSDGRVEDDPRVDLVAMAADAGTAGTDEYGESGETAVVGTTSHAPAVADPAPAPASEGALDQAPSPPPAAPPQPPRPAPSDRGPEDLLIELRTSPLGADIDHIGDRLLVFVDRVELRDRNDRVRQVLSGEDISDVVVQRKFTGAVLAVESGSGESIVTRGLKPEQADQARLLIHKRTRAGRPVTPKEAEKPRGPQRPNPSVNGPKPPDVTAPSADAVAAAAARLAILNRDRLNEADLLRKLADLHRAGVLTDIEFEEKIALVGRLVSGETLVVS